jgi:hypothetical protein
MPQPGEPPLPAGVIVALTPAGDEVAVHPDPRTGRYALPVRLAGLYELTWELPWAIPVPPPFTTPNPLEVLVTPGPDGEPQGFEEAHFGVRRPDDPPGPRVVEFSDAPLDSLHHAHWTLQEAWAHMRKLHLRVGFSGCQPDHPFALYAVGGFMESEPPQIDLVLVHELEEDCDAWFQRGLVFDMSPLYERYLDAYGPGELIMNLHDFEGGVEPFEVWIGWDDEDPGEDDDEEED